MALILTAALLCALPALTAGGPQAIQYKPKPMTELTISQVNRDHPSNGIPVNQADAEELITIRGIGPVLADRIINERETNGLFYYAEDLLSVRGIGEKTLKSIREQIQIQTDGRQ